MLLLSRKRRVKELDNVVVRLKGYEVTQSDKVKAGRCLGWHWCTNVLQSRHQPI
jgi:hypothetical protein